MRLRHGREQGDDMGAVSIAIAFRDDEAARQFLAETLNIRALPPDALLPMSKWVQAIYLTKSGTLRNSAEHLQRLLDVPADIARDVVRYLVTMDRIDITDKEVVSVGP